MKRLIVVCFLVPVLLGSTYKPGAYRIHGQVFVVTRGGENVKLGGVSVGLFGEDAIMKYIDQRRALIQAEDSAIAQRLEAARESLAVAYAPYNDAFSKYGAKGADSLYAPVEKWRDLVASIKKEQGERVEADLYFQDFPGAMYVTETDADGNFELLVPGRGKFAVAAQASRDLGSLVEKYHWLVRVPSGGNKSAKLILSNSSLTSSGSPGSLLYAAEH